METNGPFPYFDALIGPPLDGGDDLAKRVEERDHRFVRNFRTEADETKFRWAMERCNVRILTYH